MPNDMNVGNHFVNLPVTTPDTTYGAAPSLRGLGEVPQVYSLLPDLAFSAEDSGVFELSQPGRFPRGPRVPGSQGTMRIDYTLGALGTSRTLAYLSPQVVSPTQYIKVGIDTSNRPLVEVTDAAGTVVAAVTPSYAALPASGKASIHFTWDSNNVVQTPRYALLRVAWPGNEIVVPGGDWSTDPTSAWANFTPSFLVAGRSLGDADYNGSIQLIQIACTVQT